MRVGLEMKTIGLIQARMSSHRLPGKVLKPIGGVLTSTESSDDEIESFCIENGILCIRGPLGHVFLRFRNYLQEISEIFPYFFRFTADCPLICTDVVDRISSLMFTNQVDYISNTLRPTFPDGLDVEMIRTRTFLEIDPNSLNSYEIEHVTPAVYLRDGNRLGNLTHRENMSGVRLTLDTEKDLRLLNRLALESDTLQTDATYDELLKLINMHCQKEDFGSERPRITKLEFEEYA